MKAWNGTAGHLALVTLLSFGAMLAVLVTATIYDSVPILAVVIVAGSLGAAANNYQRIFSLEDQATSLDKRHLLAPRLYLGPIIGGVFAIVAYTLFLTELIKGPLFPNFGDSASRTYTSVKDLLWAAHPKTELDAARAIVWGFVAGFCERFVPNFLDRTSAEAEHIEKPKHARAQLSVAAKTARQPNRSLSKLGKMGNIAHNTNDAPDANRAVRGRRR